MTFRSILLRLVLALGVILNGSPFAMAASSVGLHDPAEMHSLAQNAEARISAMPSCHESSASVESNTSERSAQSKDVAATTPKRAVPDCCKSGHCNCACVHAAATLPSFDWRAVAGIHESVVFPVETGLPAPILPNLNRPPIA